MLDTSWAFWIDWNKSYRKWLGCDTEAQGDSTCTAASAKSLQSCLTLCDTIDGSPQGSSVPGILQAIILEWVAISFSNAGKWKVKVKSLSCARLLATPWTGAYQASLSMGFSRQEYWSGVPLPSLPTCTRSCRNAEGGSRLELGIPATSGLGEGYQPRGAESYPEWE